MNPDDLSMKIKGKSFFTKKVKSSGNQKIISVPADSSDNFKEGDEVVVFNLSNKAKKK